jgi:hypothetical protein
MAEYLKFRAYLERVALFSQNVVQFASYVPDSEVQPEMDTEK